MKYPIFARLYGEAREYERLDMYIAERGYQDWMDDFPEEELSSILTEIYNISNKSTAETIKEYMEMCKNSSVGELGIPYRTLQNWYLGTREPAPYLVCLIAYALFESGGADEE